MARFLTMKSSNELFPSNISKTEGHRKVGSKIIPKRYTMQKLKRKSRTKF